MDAPSGLALLLDIEQSENGLIATKYLSGIPLISSYPAVRSNQLTAAAFICAAWDHIITFGDEVRPLFQDVACSFS